MGVLSSQNHSNEQTSANSRNSRKSEECDVIRIGAGAGFAGDRIDPAAELAERGDLDYLVFECLGERTVALGQQRRRENSDAGYDPLLDARMRAVLPACRRSGTRIITNSGSANPLAAGRLIERVARELGLAGIRVGVVTGDDVTQAASELDPVLWETGRPISQAESPLLSANAYIGAEPIRRRSRPAPTSSSPDGPPTPPCTSDRSLTSSAGIWTIRSSSAAARSSGTCWSAPGN